MASGTIPSCRESNQSIQLFHDRPYDAALQLYFLEQEPGGLINTLVMQARLEVGVGNIQQALPLYEQAFRIADQTGFASHPVVQDMRSEYQQLRAFLDQAPQATADPLAPVLAALLEANSAQALAAVIQDHPEVLELASLERAAGLAEQARQADQRDLAVGVLARLAFLLEAYNRGHAEPIEADAQNRFIALHERLLPLAEALGGEELVAALRQTAGWACNSLGNYFADHDKDLAQAIAAYTRGVGFDPHNAMLYRNRAGVFIDLRDGASAAADIARAAALEPDAPRLADLRQSLAELPTFAKVGNSLADEP